MLGWFRVRVRARTRDRARVTVRARAWVTVRNAASAYLVQDEKIGLASGTS